MAFPTFLLSWLLICTSKEHQCKFLMCVYLLFFSSVRNITCQFLYFAHFQHIQKLLPEQPSLLWRWNAIKIKSECPRKIIILERYKCWYIWKRPSNYILCIEYLPPPAGNLSEHLISFSSVSHFSSITSLQNNRRLFL